MITDPAPTRRHESTLSLVLHHRFYRSATVSLFVYGIAMSATMPQMTLFLTRELGASVQVAGLYFLVNLAAPVAGYIVGTISDRRTDRLVIYRICAVLSGLGWLAMSRATALWMPFVLGALVLSAAGSILAQLMAAVRDELSWHPTYAENRIMSMVRMGFSAGWVVGPVLGTWVGSVWGTRTLMIMTALCALGQLIPIGRQRVNRFVAALPADAIVPARLSLKPLLIFTGLCLLVMSGDTIKFAYLPIYMADRLHASALVLGLAIAIQPLLELIMMPFAAQLADRFDPLRVLIVGTVFGAAAYACFATAHSSAGMFAGQILTSVLWACLASLGVSTAQRLYPHAVATASGVFTGAIMLASAVGGAIGGLGVGVLGLPRVFVVPGIFAAVAVAGLTLLHRHPPIRTALSDSAPGAEPTRKAADGR